jgi:integrase
MMESDSQLHREKVHVRRAQCPVCAGDRFVLYQELSQDLNFSEAFAAWISHRIIQTNGVRTNASYLAKKSERDYRVCAKALEKFFGRLRLEQIHPGYLMEYQQARATNPSTMNGLWRCRRGSLVRGEFNTRPDAEAWAKEHGGEWEVTQTLWAYPAGANCVRKEIALLIRILRAARLWGDEDELRAAGFQRLRPVESDIERAMTIEEQHRFLHTAASREEFRLIYWYSIVALQTTAGTNELRALRLGDVLLNDRIIQIPRGGAKNKYRMRAIPLVTDDAVWAMENLLARAQSLGARSAAHFLFPFRKCKGPYDPTRPMSESGLKKPWDEVRKAAGLPELRIYDLRHTGITRMAEAGVPLAVAMTFAGHMTEQMQRRYTAICMSAQRGWGESVWGGNTQQPWAASSPAAQAWPKRKPVLTARGAMGAVPVMGAIK